MTAGIEAEIVGDFAQTEAMLSALMYSTTSTHMMGFLIERETPYLKERAIQRFHNEGDDAVGMWAPLKEATKNIRSSMGFSPDHPINVRTGGLEDFITKGEPEVMATGNVAVLMMPGPSSGHMLDKLRVAQIGSDVPNTVPRPVVGLDHSDLVATLTMFAFNLQEDIVKNLPGARSA